MYIRIIDIHYILHEQYFKKSYYSNICVTFTAYFYYWVYCIFTVRKFGKVHY